MSEPLDDYPPGASLCDHFKALHPSLRSSGPFRAPNGLLHLMLHHLVPQFRSTSSTALTHQGTLASSDFKTCIFEITLDFNAGLISVHGLTNSIADLCNDLGEFDLMDIQSSRIPGMR